jgi:hypothetical protein
VCRGQSLALFQSRETASAYIYKGERDGRDSKFDIHSSSSSTAQQHFYITLAARRFLRETLRGVRGGIVASHLIEDSLSPSSCVGECIEDGGCQSAAPMSS